jgi:hypothetical protein
MPDAVDTLVGLTRFGNLQQVRIEAIRSLAAYLHDERVVRALQALTVGGEITEVAIEAVKVLGKR